MGSGRTSHMRKSRKRFTLEKVNGGIQLQSNHSLKGETRSDFSGAWQEGKRQQSHVSTWNFPGCKHCGEKKPTLVHDSRLAPEQVSQRGFGISASGYSLDQNSDKAPTACPTFEISLAFEHHLYLMISI